MSDQTVVAFPTRYGTLPLIEQRDLLRTNRINADQVLAVLVSRGVDVHFTTDEIMALKGHRPTWSWSKDRWIVTADMPANRRALPQIKCECDASACPVHSDVTP